MYDYFLSFFNNQELIVMNCHQQPPAIACIPIEHRSSSMISEIEGPELPVKVKKSKIVV